MWKPNVTDVFNHLKQLARLPVTSNTIKSAFDCYGFLNSKLLEERHSFQDTTCISSIPCLWLDNHFVPASQLFRKVDEPIPSYISEGSPKPVLKISIYSPSFACGFRNSAELSWCKADSHCRNVSIYSTRHGRQATSNLYTNVSYVNRERRSTQQNLQM